MLHASLGRMFMRGLHENPRDLWLAERLWIAEVSSGDLIDLCDVWPDQRLTVLVFYYILEATVEIVFRVVCGYVLWCREGSATQTPLYAAFWMKIVDQFPVLARPHVPGKMQSTLAFIIPLAQLRCMFNPRSKARITMQQTLISLDNLLSCYLWRDGARGRQYVKGN